MGSLRKTRGMARRATSHTGSDEEDPEDNDPEEVDAPRRRSPHPRHRGRDRTSSHRHPVRRWRASVDDESAGAGIDAPDGRPTRPPVFWRARDSLYFEPLVALAIVILLIVGMYAYTQNWPPVYVVESNSMQHGSNDVLGVINTGDLVLAQKIASTAIVPYVVGIATGYSTYGEFGDVILYHPNGVGSTPVIHRAILFLTYNPNGSYNAPDLAGLPCGNQPNAVYATPSTFQNCGTTGLTGTLDLYDVGWHPVNVSVDLSSSALGGHSGFLTLGDNNFLPSCSGAQCVGFPDQTNGISELVEPGWIIGVARGMIPWFGAVKLALEGGASMVPSQSWQFLGLTLAGLILIAFGIHYAFRAEGIEDPRRKAEEETASRDREAREQAEDEDEDEEEERPRARRFLTALRPWHRPEETEDDEPSPQSAHASARSDRLPGRRGRPRPRVRRAAKPRQRRRDEDDL